MARHHARKFGTSEHAGDFGDTFLAFKLAYRAAGTSAGNGLGHREMAFAIHRALRQMRYGYHLMMLCYRTQPFSDCTAGFAAESVS